MNNRSLENCEALLTELEPSLRAQDLSTDDYWAYTLDNAGVKSKDALTENEYVLVEASLRAANTDWMAFCSLIDPILLFKERQSK